MAVAREIAKRSHDDKYKVGCIVVPDTNTGILALGYNGNYPGGPHIRESDQPGESGFMHAELNCLLKLDFHSPYQKIMYVTLSPCIMCAKMILACKITRVVYR